MSRAFSVPHLSRGGPFSVLLLAATCLLSPIAASADPTIKGLLAVADPTDVVVPFKASSAKLALHLTNQGAGPMALVIQPRSFILKDAASSAPIGISEIDGNGTSPNPSAISLDKDQTKTIGVTVSNLQAPGTYEGGVNIVDSTGSTTLVTYTVRRQPSIFALNFRADGLTNNVWTIKPIGNEAKATFIVENASLAASVTLKAKITPLFFGNSAPVATIDPETFTVSTEQPVSLTLKNLPESGVFTGTIQVTSVDVPGLQKDLTVSIQPSFVGVPTQLTVIGLVLTGTLLSLLVGTGVPNVVARQKIYKRLNDMERVIKTKIGNGSPEQMALQAKVSQIRSVAGNIQLFAPGAADEATALTTQLDALDNSTQLVCSVHDIRQRIQSVKSNIPMSVGFELERDLNEILRLVVAANGKGASDALDAVNARIADSQLLTKVQASLKDRISELPDPTTDSKAIDVLLADAKRRAQATQFTRDDLMTLDRDCFALHLVLIRYRGRLLPIHTDDTRYAAMATQLESMAVSGTPGVWEVASIVESLEMGVFSADLEKAIADHDGEVLVAPVSPHYYDLVEFKFVFTDPKLNDSPLIKDFRWQWDFADGTAPTIGRRSIHFFKPPPRNVTQRFFAYFREVFHLSTRTDGPGSTKTVAASSRRRHRLGELFRVVATVTKPPRELLATFEIDPMLLVAPLPRGTSIVARAEVLSTFVVFLGAVVIAYMAHTADIRPFENIQDYLNPFLWGFGLDQMKALVGRSGLTASASKS